MKKVAGKNFTLVQAGKFSELKQYELKHPKMDRKVHGKLFLRDELGLTGMQISLNQLPAGISVPFYHSHKENEELYVFVGGKGQIKIDDQELDVEEGTVVRIAPEGVRTWRNNSDHDLYYLVIQAKENSLDRDTFDDGIVPEIPVEWKN
jgi:uncharacterized cupin superfamily protein